MGLYAGHLMQTHIDLAFADGEYRFALGLAQINELQNKCGAGIGAIYARVLQGRVAADPTVGHAGYAAYRIEDLRETVRQGLIGGAQGIVDGQDVTVSAMRANQLLETYLDPMPIGEQWNLAAAILYAKIDGYAPAQEEADKKKAPPATTENPLDGLTTPAL